MIGRLWMAVAMVVVSQCAYAAAAVGKGDDQRAIYQCRDVSDCVVVMGVCGWVSINREYQVQAEALFEKSRPFVECAPRGEKPKETLCRQGQCSLEEPDDAN